MLNHKILYLISTLGGGGAESQVCSFTKEISDSHPELQFKICVLKTGGVLESRLRDAEIPYVVIGGKNMLGHILAVMRLVRREGYTIIHAHMLYSDIVARVVGIFTKSKVVATHHGLGKWKKPWLIILDRITKGLVDRFVMVSDESKEIRIRREKYPINKIDVIYNGISGRFCSKQAKTMPLDKPIVIGTIARFTDNKQINVLIDAFHSLMKRHNNIHLNIIGDGENAEKLKLQVAILGIEPYVTFHGWVDDVLQIINKWHIFVLCSVNEDLPVSILETMAQGIVPVASRVGGIPFLLKNGEHGILCDSKVTETFTDGMDYLISHPDEYSIMSKKCLEYVKNNFLISEAVDKTLKIYQEITCKKASKGLKDLYYKLPVWLQNVCVSLYGFKREHDRYGGDFSKRFCFYMETEKKDASYIKDYQLKELKKLLRAADKSEYYHSLFEKNGFDINSINVLSDLSKLPILKKRSLRGNEEKFYTDKDNKNCLVFHTSGSTGTPLTVRMNKSDFRDRMALLERLKHCHGISRKMRHITFVGKIITSGKGKSFWRYNLFGHQLVMSAYDLKDENRKAYINKIKRYKPIMIEGYPSVINLVAKWFIDSGETLPLHAVFVTAETLLDEYRQNIEKAFNCTVVNYYGSTEGSVIITQCECGRLHLNYESGIVEFLREDDTYAAPGEPARMIVTSFSTKSTPLIRYDIEDMAIYSDQKCECGRDSLVIKEIIGRVDDVFQTPEKGFVSRLSTSLKLLPSEIRRAQIRQYAPENFKLLLETDVSIPESALSTALDDLKLKLGNVNIEIEFVDEIPVGANGKFRSQIKMM